MQNLNEHINNPIEMCEKTFSHEDLVCFLENGNVIEKQYAALNLDEIRDEHEARLFIANLVGVDGKIREVVAFRIKFFLEKNADLFLCKENFDYFKNGTIDIDGNVCRSVIDAVKVLKKNEEFSKYYANSMKDIINIALDEISKFTFRDKKYTINKQVFKIYWCLEALINFYEYIDYSELKLILKKCSLLQEYTVREKCAKIIKILNCDEELELLKNQLKNDENYYVRNIFC